MNDSATFEVSYTPPFAALLHQLGASLAISTYQAGKVILLSPLSSERIIQLPRTFPSAMGMAVEGECLAVASKKCVEVLKNVPALASTYPNKPNEYDNLYMPRATYHTGYLALHDMGFIDNKLIAVNTLFSTLCYIDQAQSFSPFWQPPFITDLMPEDRCHLNGMAVENGEIKYLTALGATNTMQGWRENKIHGGILMEFPSGKILKEGLSMPHSPRIFDEKLYVLNSAQGELLEVNRETGHTKVLVNLGGFARGMDRIGDYLFIGVSKLRHTNEVFMNLPIANTSFAGVIAVHLPSASIAGTLEYSSSVEEIYDVKVLPGKLRPNILSTEMEVHQRAIAFHQTSLWTEAEDKKENPQEPEHIKSEQEVVHLQVMKNVAPAELQKLFGNMMGKDLMKAIQNSDTSKNLNLIVSSNKANPLGLLVFEAKANRSVRILSVFVKPEHRRKGLGKLLLNHLQTLLQQNGIQYTEAVFTRSFIEETIVNKLFARFDNINVRIED